MRASSVAASTPRLWPGAASEDMSQSVSSLQHLGMGGPGTKERRRFVVLVRHGERADDVGAEAASAPHGDPGLTERGTVNVADCAGAITTALSDRGVDLAVAHAAGTVRVVSSPFLRTRQTADALCAAGLGHGIVTAAAALAAVDAATAAAPAGGTLPPPQAPMPPPYSLDCELCEVFGPVRIKTPAAPTLADAALSPAERRGLPRWGETIDEAHARFVRCFRRYAAARAATPECGSSASGTPTQATADDALPTAEAVAPPRPSPASVVVLVTHGDALDAVYRHLFPNRFLFDVAYLAFLVVDCTQCSSPFNSSVGSSRRCVAMGSPPGLSDSSSSVGCGGSGSLFGSASSGLLVAENGCQWLEHDASFSAASAPSPPLPSPPRRRLALDDVAGAAAAPPPLPLTAAHVAAATHSRATSSVAVVERLVPVRTAAPPIALPRQHSNHGACDTSPARGGGAGNTIYSGVGSPTTMDGGVVIGMRRASGDFSDAHFADRRFRYSRFHRARCVLVPLLRVLTVAVQFSVFALWPSSAQAGVYVALVVLGEALYTLAAFVCRIADVTEHRVRSIWRYLIVEVLLIMPLVSSVVKLLLFMLVYLLVMLVRGAFSGIEAAAEKNISLLFGTPLGILSLLASLVFDSIRLVFETGKADTLC